jgi:hypothetical protein
MKSEIRNQKPEGGEAETSNIEGIKVKDASTTGGHPTGWQF